MTKIRTYSELRKFDTFEERFRYLKLNSPVGRPTFGTERHINQSFYGSFEWKRARNTVIARDKGCDLGVLGYEIHVDILVHHINPMDVSDIVHGEEWIIDPEYLITTTQTTHNAIHYGHDFKVPPVVVSRQPGDTRLW